MAKAINYREGECIAVPLRNGGFARGIIARLDGKGLAFGYFFGPKFDEVQHIECSGLSPRDAILIGLFGDLGLLRGDWRVVGRVPEWNREEWPFPPLARVDEKANKAWLSYYDEESLSVLEEIPISPTVAEKYPYDRTMGFGAVEIRLTKLLEKGGAH